MNDSYPLVFIILCCAKDMHSLILSDTPDVEWAFRAYWDIAFGVWQVLDNLDCLSMNSKSIEDLGEHESIEEENTSFRKSKYDVFLFWAWVIKCLLDTHLVLSLVEYLCIKWYNFIFRACLYNLHASDLLWECSLILTVLNLWWVLDLLQQGSLSYSFVDTDGWWWQK